ncbi:signal peptidase I [Paludicola sp. MB14-C6]|uniref:signal peptidase I n=1 Tax=Paludihabitans sp. MB14-C6 TaxID=3070656 RepID=UPI0027DBBE96|nr:signal peptidase I [Paludicola sp. MB14-C6]WMJ23944.1 signal peptidase I [Paludicola sp. MB14-C6]
MKTNNIDVQEADNNKKDGEKTSVKQEVFQWVQSLVVSVVIVALIITFVGRVMDVKGESMLPTFHDGDRVITTNLYKDLKRGDVVVIKRKGDTPLIKRVIAVENEKIDINFKTGEVSVNGVILKEDYINEVTHSDLGTQLPATVPKGHVFVMGDNRNHSLDSRDPSVGMVDERNVFGKVIFRIYPFNKMGKVK